MSDLSNIYATLSRKYGDNYAITYTALASYLANIIGTKESRKVVFFYKEDRDKMASASTFISPARFQMKVSPPSSTDLDLTGSPLKDDCIADAISDISIDLKLLDLSPWKLDEEFHRGVEVDKARFIMCSEEFQQDQKAAGSVWFLCNCADADKTLLLQHEFDANHFIRGIVTFLGMVHPTAVVAPALLRQHYSLINNSARVEFQIENTYHIKPHIALRCSWTTAAVQPTLIDLSSCTVKLSQTFRLGHASALTEDFVNQLRILMFIRDDILAYHQNVESGIVGKEAVYRCGRGIDMGTLRESVNMVMAEMSGFAEIEADSGTDGDVEAVVLRAKARRLTDLTDKLWEILKCCSSYKDLKIAFNILFQCAARCNLVNTPTNTNHLAEIITEIANRRLAIPCLTGAEPLELLLEIGLEKLYKDYEYIFAESKICSGYKLRSYGAVESPQRPVKEESALPTNSIRKSLRNAMRVESVKKARTTLLHNKIKSVANKYANGNDDDDDPIGFKNSNFDEHDTATKLGKLLQMHCTLEHILMIHINLNLSTGYADVCEQLMRQRPRIIDTIDETLIDQLEISLPENDVREHLEGRQPHKRHITMKSENRFREVSTTFFYSMDNICPPGISEAFNCEGKEMIKENIYYCWMYRKIKTLK